MSWSALFRATPTSVAELTTFERSNKRRNCSSRWLSAWEDRRDAVPGRGVVVLDFCMGCLYLGWSQHAMHKGKRAISAVLAALMRREWLELRWTMGCKVVGKPAVRCCKADAR